MTLITLGPVNVGNVDRLRFTVTKDDDIWDLSNAGVEVIFKHPTTGVRTTVDATIEDATNGIVYYDTLVTDLTTAGTWKLSVRITDGSVVKTYPDAITLIVNDRP